MKYSKSFRNAILKKVLPPENRSVYSVAKEAGIAVVTINNWLANLKDSKLTVEQDTDDPVNERSMKEKFDLLLEHQKIPGESEGEWLRQKGPLYVKKDDTPNAILSAHFCIDIRQLVEVNNFRIHQRSELL